MIHLILRHHTERYLNFMLLTNREHKKKTIQISIITITLGSSAPSGKGLKL